MVYVVYNKVYTANLATGMGVFFYDVQYKKLKLAGGGLDNKMINVQIIFMPSFNQRAPVPR